MLLAGLTASADFKQQKENQLQVAEFSVTLV